MQIGQWPTISFRQNTIETRMKETSQIACNQTLREWNVIVFLVFLSLALSRKKKTDNVMQSPHAHKNKPFKLILIRKKLLSNLLDT